ncbi:hypothetical protein SSCS72_02463 [Mammaliicoccus sciuri]|nr:hypothetical protein SSCS72_02463 [Mammaliicoccus sciuri]
MKLFFKFMSIATVLIYILIKIQNIVQDYLEIKNGEYKEE